MRRDSVRLLCCPAVLVMLSAAGGCSSSDGPGPSHVTPQDGPSGNGGGNGTDGAAETPGGSGGQSGGDGAAAADGGPPALDGGTGGDGGATPTMRRSPNEVLLVMNGNSPTSMAIAADYAARRGITNTLTVTCADSAKSAGAETIQLADYTTSIATPMQAYLTAHPQINFIVLTKGIPIRINGGSTGFRGGGGLQPSLDSYLAAIDYPTIPGAVKISITGGSGWLNRYWNSRERFTHAKFGGYLVTRLDGYTQADAMALVTRCLAADHGITGPVLLDLSTNYGVGNKDIEPAPVTMNVTAESNYGTWNADMLHAHDILEASGIANQLDATATFIGGVTNLGGYFSWGSNDGRFNSAAYQSLTFAPGAISDTAVSTSGRTFLPTSGGQTLLADLIAHGLTAGKGYVTEPLLQAIASPTIAVDRYFGGFTMAESMYAASRFTGWEDVAIGDPLCAPYADASRIAEPVQAATYAAASADVQKEPCSEGGSDVTNINNASYTSYAGVTLTGAVTFAARVASAGPGGNVEVHVDSAAGATIATCAVPVTGDNQKWTTVTCPLTATVGTHQLFLVYTGGAGRLFSVEWFALRR